VFADGARVSEMRSISPHVLQKGIFLRLGSYLLLRLGIYEDASDSKAFPELVGHSRSMRSLRSEIGRLADLDLPVLLRGETGVGKDLIATALHRASHRCAGPYVRVNLAAIPPPMAAGTLFGHARGAFTGATEARDGYFVDAHGGTLFLDEIGETPLEVQGVLLRTIESGEIQPIGAAVRSVATRLIAATESDLEAKVALGTFSRGLLQRFGYVLWVSPLREHMEDVPLLFSRFLTEELQKLGEEERLWGRDTDQNPYLTADFMLQLLDYRWPGNVRELKSIALRFAIHNRGRARTEVDPRLQAILLGAPAEAPAKAPARPASVPPRPESDSAPVRREALQLKDQDVLDALRRFAFEIDRTARELGVSRSWLHARMNSLAGVRKAKDLRGPEIQAALDQHDGDIERAARQLEVSAKGLQLQITRLGLRNGGGDPAQ
jgi:two-component system nitrogen regulation response regulator GlnG